MRDDYRVVIAAGNARHRALAVAGRKVFAPGDEKVRLWIQFEELRAPLFYQVVGHHKHGLLRKPQAAHFHGGGGHGPGLSGAYHMRQQGVAAAHAPPDGILLMAVEIPLAQQLARHARQ